MCNRNRTTMSRRTEQLESTLQRAVGQMLAEGMNDPRLEGAMISVTQVAVSPDQRHATVHVSVMPEDRTELVMHGLQSARSHVQATLSRSLDMRKAPQITFRLDETLKTQSRILGAIARAVGIDAERTGNDEPQQTPITEDPGP